MKNILISLAALLLVGSMATAQHRGNLADFDSYVPVTLDGVSALTALSMSTSTDDTTMQIDTRGWSYIGLSFVSTADSIGLLVSFQTSVDGITWSPLTVTDSVISRVTAIAPQGAVALPDDQMAFPYVRFRLYASADANFGANPAPTIGVKVVRRR